MGREGRASSPSAASSPSTRLASGAGRGWLTGSWPLFSLEGKHRQGPCAASPAAPGHCSAPTACLGTQVSLRATVGAGARPLCPGRCPSRWQMWGWPQGRRAVGTQPSSAFWLLAAVGLGAAGPARLGSFPAGSYEEAEFKSSSGGSNFGTRLFKEPGQAPFLPRPLTSRMVARVLNQCHMSSWSLKQDRAPAILPIFPARAQSRRLQEALWPHPATPPPRGSLSTRSRLGFVACCLSLPAGHALSVPQSLACSKCLPSE